MTTLKRQARRKKKANPDKLGRFCLAVLEWAAKEEPRATGLVTKVKTGVRQETAVRR